MARHYTAPRRADLRPGGRYGQHVMPAHYDEGDIQFLVSIVFKPNPPYSPCHPRLVRQLLDHAPRARREAWLRRADEVCRAWGRPLYGPGGLTR